MTKRKNQKSTKIFLDQNDYDYIMDYKEASGVPIQVFVEQAIKEKIANMEAKNVIDNLELLKK